MRNLHPDWISDPEGSRTQTLSEVQKSLAKGSLNANQAALVIECIHDTYREAIRQIKMNQQS